MKKIFTSLILLLMGVMVSTVQAQTLKINGQTVNLTTSSTITGTGISGTVKYNASEKRLDLTNATITAPEGSIAIESTVSGLRIYLNGANEILSSSDKVSMRFDADVTFCGSGDLNVYGRRSIVYGGSKMTVYACRLTIDSSDDTALQGLDGNPATLSIQYNGALWLKSKSSVLKNFNAVEYKTGKLLSGSVTGTEAMMGDDYGLMVAGVEVTPFNYDNITGAGISGTVKMNGKNGSTLMLNNATITCSTYGINLLDSSKEYTINLTGNNTINSGGYRGITGQNGTDCKPLNITGTGTLSMQSSYGILHRGNVNIKDCSLDLSSVLSCIRLEDYGTLTIDNAKVHLKTSGSSSAAVEKTVGVNYLNGCMETGPTIYDGFPFYSSNLKGIACFDGSNTNLAKEVNIEPTYGVIVCGVPLTKAMGSSQFNVTGESIEGSVSYNPTNNVLTLSNASLKKNYVAKNSLSATLTVLDFNGDKTITGSSFPELSILVLGDCHINHKEGKWKNCVINSENDLYFYGQGRLNMESNAGIRVKGSGRWIEFAMQSGGELVDKSYNYAIWGYNNDLTLKFSGSGATYYFKGQTQECVKGVSSVTMGNYKVLAPSGASFSSSLKTFAKSGTAVKNEWLVFGTSTEEYGLEIGSTPVTNANAIDPLGDGAFTYNNDEKTLKVNASSTPGGVNAITNKGISDLTIDFQKSLTLTGGNGGGAIVAYKNTTIKSSTSSLVTLSAGNTGINAVQGAHITIDGVNMLITKPSFGISGHSSGTPDLTIKSSKIAVESGSGAIRGFSSITLDNCHVESPAGGAVSGGKVVESNGTTIAKSVIIGLGASGIQGVSTDSSSDAEIKTIYDAQGRKTNELQPGINIIRMTDGTTKKVVVK